MNRYAIIIAALFSLVCTRVHAEEKSFIDKVMEWPVIGIIYPSLSPETGWAGGIGIQGGWKMPHEETSSWLRLTGNYTQYRQWRLHMEGIFYMSGKTPWLLRYDMQYRDYPDLYYGIGNSWDRPQPVHYGSKRFDYRLEPMFRLPGNWNVGPMTEFLWETTNLIELDATYTGKSHTLMWGLGITSQFDTRDGKHYPTRGILLDMKGFYCEPYLGADCRLTKLDVDFRHFLTLWQPKEPKNNFDRVNRSLIFAYQVRMQAALSQTPTEQIPFQMLPVLGGEMMLRGLRTNMFRDEILWAVQSELRFPIYSIVRGTVFASIGDVYNTKHWQGAVPKIGYGIGLRAAINHDYVTIRFDVARNNMDHDWGDIKTYSFYITASEAF